LRDGYANLSRKAIINILPFLKLGYTYDVAVVLGGIKSAFGSEWQNLEEERKQFLLDNVLNIVRSKIKGGFIDELKDFLVQEFKLSAKQLKKLYHHSANITEQKILEKLPYGTKADLEIQEIRNPIVITAIFELRRLINEIIERYGKPDEIKIELARDLKISKTKRAEIGREQKRLENENDRVKKMLNEIGQVISHDNILKYKLWEECNNICPYTGTKISESQLFSADIQIEHINPWSRSLNDSFMNKTLCLASENIFKGNKTPYEFYFKEQGEKKWEEVKARALSCFKNKKNYPNAYSKFKQFVKKEYESDFISRQLNDTRYISREAKKYLSKICENVMVAPGQMTANLRQKWGLNSILNDENTKRRDDHRHHAIDALVMACSTKGHLNELSRWNRYNRKPELKDFPMPWQNFYTHAKERVEGILVSHKKRDRVLTIRNHTFERDGKKYTNKGVAARGQLHKEFVFGKRKAPGAEDSYHIRKPIEALKTKKQLEKVVDAAIKKLIYNRIDKLGGFEKEDRIPPETFFTTDEKGQKTPALFLPNKNGDPIPVKKIRMAENLSGAEQIKPDINQYVNPRSNHHVIIYIDKNEKLKEQVVTFWTAVERKLNKDKVFQLPLDGKQVVTTMQINDIFILGIKEDSLKFDNLTSLKNNLYRVQKLSSKFYEFRSINESKVDKNTLPYYIRIQSFGEGKTGWFTYNPIKVSISPIGQIKVSKR